VTTFVLTDQQFNDRLLAWAESLTAEEKAEAREQLAQWCEARDTKGTKAGQ